MFTPRPLRRTLPAALRDLTSSRADVRESAARDLALAGQDDPSTARQALVPLLDDAHASVRAEAVMALGAVGAGEHTSALARRLDDEDSTVRQYAALALGQTGGPEALDALERAWRGTRADVRFQALLAIVSANPRRGVELSLEALTDGDVWIASEAAEQLGMLLSRGTGGDDAWAHGEHTALAARAREALRTVTATGRAGLCVAMALARLDDDRGRDTIERFVANELDVESSEDEADLRLDAIALLGRIGGESTQRVLAERAWRWRPSAEREAARAALARLGDARACERVLTQLRSRWASEREDAVLQAREARMRAAVPLLAALLQEGGAQAVVVIDALEDIGGARAIEALRAFADRGPSDAESREAAQEALARMGTRDDG